MDWRRVAGGATQGSTLRMQDDQKNRRGPARASGSPEFDQGNPCREAGGGRDDNLHGTGAVADEQSCRLDAMT